MNCDSAFEYLHRLLDGELDDARRFEIESHVQGCANCAELSHHLYQLRSAVRETAPYYTPPDDLAPRIRARLREAARGENLLRMPRLWAAAAAVLVLGIAGAYLLATRQGRAQEASAVAREVAASHVRSLQAAHLFDVPSTDQHTVKPWFTGKLDFSPNVKDLAKQNFQLTGGRLDYLNGGPAAALVYRRRQHVINLFEWPSARDSETEKAVSDWNGFHLVTWKAGGMTYWAVSDLNLKELQEFARVYQE